MWTGAYYGFWRYWQLYHKVTFDGPNRIIIVNRDETLIDVEQDIYSDWKEWSILEENMQYPQALSTIGGEPLGGGQFVGATFFLENGWRIRPPEQSSTIEFVGNLFTREAGDTPTVPTLGAWNNTIIYTRSNLVLTVEVAGTGSSVSINPYEIAQAVWSYSTTSSLQAASFGDHLATKVATFAHILSTK